MTIPAERLQVLREQALAADVEPISDPAELARQSVRAHREDIGETVRPELPEVGIRMHSPGVPGYDVPASKATPILSAFQELITAIGQVITQRAASGVPVNATVARFAETRTTPELLPGPVTFWLAEPSEVLSGNEFAALAGSETLADATMSALFAIVNHSADTEDASADGELAQELRRLGPRVAGQLSSLADAVMNDQIELDLTWRTSRGRSRRARLPMRSASTLHDVIKLNEDLQQH